MKQFRLFLSIILVMMCTCVMAHNNIGRQLMDHAALTRGANDVPQNGIVDNGNSLQLTYVTTMGSTFYVGLVMTAEFDGSLSTSKCIKCVQETVSNIPGALDGEETMTDLTEDYLGMTKAEVLAGWKTFYGSLIGGDDDDDDDDEGDWEEDNEAPDDLVTVGSIKDLGNQLVVKFHSSSESAHMWADGEITADFDGTTDSALCIKARMKGRSNVPGEENVDEDMTADFEGMTKAQVYMLFRMMLDKLENWEESLGSVSSESPVTGVYGIDGVRLDKAARHAGFGIVKRADGSVQKVQMH